MATRDGSRWETTAVLALFEFLTYQDPDDELKHKVDEWSIAIAKMNIENRYYTALLASHKPLFLTGPAYGPDSCLHSAAGGGSRATPDWHNRIPGRRTSFHRP